MQCVQRVDTRPIGAEQSGMGRSQIDPPGDGLPGQHALRARRRHERLRKPACGVVLGDLVRGKPRRGDMAMAGIVQPSQGCRIQNRTFRKNMSRHADSMRQDAAERVLQGHFTELQKQILSTRVVAWWPSHRHGAAIIG